MKLKINWKELGKQLWDAVRCAAESEAFGGKPREARTSKAKWLQGAAPVLLGALGGGLVAVTGSGCSSLTPSAKTQTMGVYAIGIPGIAVVTQSTQNADNTGDDDNRPVQANPVSVKVPVK